MDIYPVLSSISHNSHYLNRYIKFIIACNGSGKIKHHICPGSMFPEYISLKTNLWNCALLTDRQHFIAHWLLWKAYRNRAMSNAFRMMHKLNITSKVRDALKSDNTGRIWTAESRLKSSIASKGVAKSEEHKASLKGPKSEAHKLAMRKPKSTTINMRKPKSEEHKLALRKPQTQITCPHCNLTGGIGNMNRYHMSNCKNQ